MPRYDAIVIGSGPNGLSAAIALARAGRSVLVREGAPTIGGSCQSAELTLPGFTNDICSTVHAMAGISPFLRTLPLADHGLELCEPEIAFAHPLDDGTAAAVFKSMDATVEGLGEDGAAYRKLFQPLMRELEQLCADILGPPRLPAHPLLMAQFGLSAIRSAHGLATSKFAKESTRALFAGAAAHSILPLTHAATAAFGLVLILGAHATGWPVARGGSQKVADALASYFRSLGGIIETNAPVTNVDELPPATAVLCDITPRQLLQIARHRLPDSYCRRLERFQCGPGAFKLDWALDGPIPWKSPVCTRAGTLHLGGTLDELTQAEADPWAGRVADRPYVLLVQSSLFDATRAPAGKHTVWAYCHVSHGSTQDMTEAIEAQVERFAPGFRSRIIGRHAMNTAALERHNPNLVGGDINGGAQMLSQLFTRPVASLDPYATPAKNLYLCSSSTPPGGGVHGMCGFFAAQSALRRSLS